ncbi:lipopolysaccharide biosynthesis protein [Bacillus songklensis]|uniref:Lipopolysaccharide biosynthesis protein n=1 Tax=Bacillus songklensis TaxID=1069116 RepID=A0ABV8B339_9BACI
MKINQRRAGVLLSYGYTGINALVGFIYVPLLIFFLGKDEYGLYQIMGSILVYLSLFDFGLSNTVTRYYSKYLALKDEKGGENLLAISTIIYLVLTLVLIFAGTILYFFIDDIYSGTLTTSELITSQKMYIIILFNVSITISTAVFKSIIEAHEKFVFLKGLSILQTIIRPIVVLAVFSIESSALILVIIEAFINIVAVAIKIFYTLNKLKVKIKFSFWDKPLFKEMIRFSFFVFITAIMDQLFWRSDQLILGAVSGTSEVAIFSIASQIVSLYMALSIAMSGVFLPNVTKRVMNHASNSELSELFIKIGRIQYLLLGAVLIGFILYGQEFITIWVGEGFRKSYYITLIIMIPFTIDLIQNIGLTILQAKNLYSFRALVFLGMAIIKVAVSIPVANYYGGIGTAFVTGVSFLIGNGLIMNIYYNKEIGLDIYSFWKAISKLSIPLLFAYGIGKFIDLISIGTPILTLLIKLALFIIVYIFLIFNLGMNQYEKGLIKGSIQFIIKLKKKTQF